MSATADAFVPLTFAPGEAYQFDWSHEIVVMDGLTTIVEGAHLRLCHSRMMFVRAYPALELTGRVPINVSITNLRSTSSTQDSTLNKFDVIITYGHASRRPRRCPRRRCKPGAGQSKMCPRW